MTVIGLGLFVLVAAQAQPTDSARTLVLGYLAAQQVPGATVAVARGGRLIWSQATGLADLEHRVAVTTDTKFRVGSISKALTSVALARLWEAGSVDLDAPVQRYVPSFPDKGYPISTRQLAGHLSGLPHYTAADVVNRTRYPSVTAALDKFKDRPLLFPPGQRYAYSSYGWNLISVVVEAASGQEFLAHMKSVVFDPFGMINTLADQYDSIIPNRTGFYHRTSTGTIINGPAVDNSDVWAGGGFLSTAEDLTRFGHGVVTGALLTDRGRVLLFTPMRTADGKETGYGLGWNVGLLGGRKVVGHGGSHVGASAQLLMIPELDLVVAILTNSNNRGLEPLARELLNLFAGAAGGSPR